MIKKKVVRGASFFIISIIAISGSKIGSMWWFCAIRFIRLIVVQKMGGGGATFFTFHFAFFTLILYVLCDFSLCPL